MTNETNDKTERCKYIISEYRKDTKQTWYVCARPGWSRSADGTQKCDGCFNGGPEWTQKREHAFEFETYYAARRVQATSPSSKVHPLLVEWQHSEQP